MPQPAPGERRAAGQDGHRPSAHDLYRHLRDQGISEAELEQFIGEGWSIQDLYEQRLEAGSIEAI